jgi:polyketide synthase 13
MKKDSFRNTEEVEQWLMEYVSEQTGIATAVIDKDTALARYGLTSADAALLCCELERATGMSLPATLAWDYPDIRSLAKFLSTVEGGGTLTC